VGKVSAEFARKYVSCSQLSKRNANFYPTKRISKGIIDVKQKFRIFA